jgi:site-specific DNA-methyltransferase (adenine-specific)
MAATVPIQAPLEAFFPAFSTSRGAVYQTDCLDLLHAIRDGVINTVFADPPFNLGKDYGRGSNTDELGSEEYLAWCHRWIDECIRIVKPGGAIFIYNLPRWAYQLAGYLEAKGMLFRHWIAVSMKGTFPRGKKLYPAHYALLYFTKGTPATFNRDEVRQPIPTCRHCGGDVKDYGGHRKYLNPLGLNLTDIWDDTAPARHSQFKARWGINELKPVIPAPCIQLTTKPEDVVLDPFGGGGSTFEAAELLGRSWLGSEIVDCSLTADRFSRNVPGALPGLPAQLSSVFKEPNRRLSFIGNSCPELSKNGRLMGQKTSSPALVSTSFSKKSARLSPGFN